MKWYRDERPGRFKAQMDEVNTFDDATTEMFLGGAGRDIDACLADVIGEMRVSYASVLPVVAGELAALMQGTAAAVPALTLPASRGTDRSRRTRAALLGKVGVAVAAIVAGTGGLAVAGALPAPLQATMAQVGIGHAPGHGNSAHHGHRDGGSGVGSQTTGTGPDGTANDGAPGSDGAVPGASAHSNVAAVARANAHACDHQPSALHAQPCRTTGTTGTTGPTGSTTNGTTSPTGSPTSSTVPADSTPGNSGNNGLHKGVTKNQTSTGTTPTTAFPTTPTSNSHAHGGNQTTPNTGNGNGNANNNGNAKNNGKAKGK